MLLEEVLAFGHHLKFNGSRRDDDVYVPELTIVENRFQIRVCRYRRHYSVIIDNPFWREVVWVAVDGIHADIGTVLILL